MRAEGRREPAPAAACADATAAGIDLDALAPIEAELESLPFFTPAEQAEALLVLLGVGEELAAAALGVSPRTVRARRRRIADKLERARARGAA